MSKPQYIIQLPAAEGRRIDRAAKRQKRKPSDVAVDAIRLYFAIPTEAATAAERRAIARGEAAYRKGDYITLDDYFRAVGDRPRLTRKKVSRTRSIA